MPTVSLLQRCLLLAENNNLMLHGVFDIRDNFGLLRVTVPSRLPQVITTLQALPCARAVEALWS